MEKFIERLIGDEHRIRELYQILWTKAVATPDYNKKEWMELQLLLKGQGVTV